MEHLEIGALPPIHRSAWEQSRPRREITIIEGEDRRLRPDSSSAVYIGKQQSEMQDQLKVLRDELLKKEKLISQLTSVENPKPKPVDPAKLEDLFLTENTTAIAHARSELASAIMRVDGLQSQLRETQAQLEVRDDKLRELRTQLECARETETKMVGMVQGLRNRLVEYEAHTAGLEARSSRSDLVIDTLQQENRQTNDRVIELETKLRLLTEEHQTSSNNNSATEKKLMDLLSKMATLLGTQESTADNVQSKMASVLEEQAALKTSMAVLQERERLMNDELAASKMTISRLTSELQAERSLAAQGHNNTAHISQENEDLLAKQRTMQRDMDSLKEQLESTQRAWTNTKIQLEEAVERQAGQQGGEVAAKRALDTCQASHRHLVQSLAEVIGVESRDELVLEHVHRLAMARRNDSSRISALETEVGSLMRQLEAARDEQRKASQLLTRAEEQAAAAEHRLTAIHTHTDVSNELRDTIEQERKRCTAYLDRISRALNLALPTDGSVGVEKVCEVIVERAVQLAREDEEVGREHKSHVRQLQHKIKAAKDQLHSRDLHMDLLRKKIASLEERLTGQSGVERENSEEFVKNRKLLKLVEKYKNDLAEAREEIRDLKARLLESSNYRVRMLERDQDLERLQVHVIELERIRAEQAGKISSLLGNVDDVNREFTDKREVANNTIAALTSELRTTRTALDDTQKREQQLLDLRRVMARMLGLDVNVLAVPDFEIVSRLEQLIMAGQSSASAALTMDAMLADMESSFRQGYDDAARMMKTMEYSASPHRRLHEARARSPVKATLN